MREIPPPVFSRRSFLFFIVLAPACLLAVAGIVLTLQYKQFRTMVSPVSTIPPIVTTAETLRASHDILGSLAAFAGDPRHDTLTLSPEELNVLAAVSPVLEREEMRFRFSITPASATAPEDGTLLAVESSRPLNALNGRLAWLFQRIAPVQDGWLNARMIGFPELKSGQLSFVPERGFMNDTKVPKAAMTKRGGMSPKDFLEPAAIPQYHALLAILDTVYWNGSAVVLVRRTDP